MRVVRVALDAENTLHVLGFLRHFHAQLASPVGSAVGSLQLLDGLQANAGDSDWTQLLDSTFCRVECCQASGVQASARQAIGALDHCYA